MDHPPTAEQGAARDLFRFGDNLAIEAGAGTGKTTTLRMIASDAADRQGQYVAFNRSIVLEAQRTMPSNVAANTMHSLAMGAIGYKYRARLRESSRQPGDQVARYLGIDPFVITFGTQRKVLQPGYLAGLVQRAVSVFCQTADDTPADRHVPYVDGIDLPDSLGRRGWANNREVRRHIAGAVQRAWVDVQRLEGGRLRFRHEHYLKMWQLSHPTLPVDFLMCDECQPPWTVVDTPAGPRRIADLEVGDRVVSYTKGNVLSDRVGSLVIGKTTRHHEGELIVVADGVHETRYTPNHIAMARIGAAFEHKQILYMMEKDGRYRVGVTKGRHGTGPGRTTGLMGRLREERGEKAWVLAVFDSRAEAEAAEQITSLVWRLPQTRFDEDRPSVPKFWASWDTAYSDPMGCLAHYQRDIRYPLIGLERRYMLGDRFTEIRACNLINGMEMRTNTMEFVPVTVAREPYSGPVVSLAVSGPATYVADRIITHNCQDTSPVMLDVVARQTHAQLVFVGDSQQQIYEFTGAVNALAKVPASQRVLLTQSFRFGHQIAAQANHVLAEIGTDMRLRGSDTIASRVGRIESPRCILTRTNATAVNEVLRRQKADQHVHLIGGGTEVLTFAKAARELQRGQSTWHPELACFTTWGEVQAYVEQDPQGSELALLVTLVDTYGVDTIVSALERMCPEEAADVVVSTAHKSKGREWESVQMADDFPDPRQSFAAMLDAETALPELRLAYVAATRAIAALDVTRVPLFDDVPAGVTVAPAAALTAPLALEAGDK